MIRRPRFARRSASRFAAGVVSGVALFAATPSASAQILRDAPEGFQASENGISVRAQVDVMFQREDGGPTVLVQDSFITGASGQNLSSEYIFEILNRAALAGLDGALMQGATSGRVNVVAVCYQFGVEGDSFHSLAPLGVFINTTDMDVLPDGKAAFRTNVKFIPPTGAAAPPIEGDSSGKSGE